MRGKVNMFRIVSTTHFLFRSFFHVNPCHTHFSYSYSSMMMMIMMMMMSYDDDDDLCLSEIFQCLDFRVHFKVQSNLHITDMLCSEHSFIADTFSVIRRITVTTLQNSFHIAVTYIAGIVHNGHLLAH